MGGSELKLSHSVAQNRSLIRVQYITDSFFMGGDTRTEIWMLERMDKRHFSITAVTAPTGPAAESVEHIDGIRHLWTDFGTARESSTGLPRKGKIERIGHFANSLQMVARAAWRTKPHVVFTGDRTRPMLAAQLAAKVGSSLLVFHPHLFPGPGIEHARLRRRTALAADLVVAPSRYISDGYRLLGVPSEKLLLAHNGLDPDHFSPGLNVDVRERFRIQADRLLIGIVGVLRPFKGHDVLLRAMPQIRGAIPNAHLLIVGDGPLRQELERISSELGLNEYVTFTGTIQDPAPVYRAVDLYVMASMEEGFGLVTIEAMACEKAVVATASGGTLEIVGHNETGLLVSPGSATDLADACITLLRDPQRRQTMGRKGRRRVLEQFTLQRRADRIAGALDSLATVKQRRGVSGR